MITEELHYRMLTALDAEPEISQRKLARRLKVSLGKVNGCLRDLMERGWIHVEPYRNAENKQLYAYELTAPGRVYKSEITIAFLDHKQREFERLEREIERLQSELGANSKNS